MSKLDIVPRPLLVVLQLQAALRHFLLKLVTACFLTCLVALSLQDDRFVVKMALVCQTRLCFSFYLLCVYDAHSF